MLDGAQLDLSRKEFDLLVRLMRDAGRVVTREDLMTDVWDENWFGSTKTLDVHIGFLRRKLGDDPAEPRFMHTVRGVGFRFAARKRALSLRARLLIALGYLVALVIVAFAVPLGLNLRDRVGTEVRADARTQADVLAAGVGRLIQTRDRARARRRRAAAARRRAAGS